VILSVDILLQVLDLSDKERGILEIFSLAFLDDLPQYLRRLFLVLVYSLEKLIELLLLFLHLCSVALFFLAQLALDGLKHFVCYLHPSPPLLEASAHRCQHPVDVIAPCWQFLLYLRYSLWVLRVCLLFSLRHESCFVSQDSFFSLFKEQCLKLFLFSNYLRDFLESSHGYFGCRH
jgi:hypothetical protein